MKTLGCAFAWGISVMVGVILASGLLATIVPSEIRTDSGVVAPKVGQTYSKEEIDRNERLAKEELEKARLDFAKEGFSGQIRDGWTRVLPYVAIAAVGVILVATKRVGSLAVVATASPTLAVLLFAQINPIFPVLVISILIGFLMWCGKWPSGSMK